MSNPQSRRLSVLWTQLLELLEIPVPGQALPATTTCPLCKNNRLVIHDDQVCGGQWFVCSACQQFGDMIELAAKVWQVSPTSAIEKLVRRGCAIPHQPADIERYLSQAIDNHHRLLVAWQNARQHLLNGSTVVAKLLHELRLTCDIPLDRWKTGPGWLYGSLPKLEIERAFHQHVQSKLYNPAASRVFRGQDWEDVLIVPFFDLPHRICGFYLAGRDGREQDCFYRQITWNRAVDYESEAGMAMHPRALQVAREWDNRVLVLPHPFLMIQLQARQLEQSTDVLPAVACLTEPRARTMGGWYLLKGYRPVLWATQLTPMILHQAIVGDADLYIASVPNDSAADLREYMARQVPIDFVRRAFAKAKPWPIVFARHIRQLTVEGLEDFIKPLMQLGANPVEWLARLPDEAANQLKNLTANERLQPTHIIGTWRYFERGDNWYRQKIGRLAVELISDAILRIEEIVRLQGQTRYRGYIRFKKQNIPFFEPASVVETHTARWIKSHVEASEIGSPTLRLSAKVPIANLARYFHPPVFTKGLSAVGWCSEKAQFRLPQFNLTDTGDVLDPEPLLDLDQLPARFVEPPQAISPLELELTLQEGPQSELLWACLIAAIANITAPAKGRKTAGIGLFGEGARVAGQAIGTALGCLNMPLQRKADLDDLCQQERGHSWPIQIIPSRFIHSETWLAWVEHDVTQNHNALAPVDWWLARTKALFGGWTIISSANSFHIEAHTIRAMQQLAMAYLQDLCKRRLQLPASECWFDTLRHDLAAFIGQRTDYVDPILNSRNLVIPDSEQGCAEAFADLTSQLMLDSELIMLPEGFADNKQPTLLRCSDGLYINRDELARLLRRKKVLCGDHLRVTSVLQQAGVLVQDRHDGWLIDTAWWENHFQAYRKNNARFRVIG